MTDLTASSSQGRSLGDTYTPFFVRAFMLRTFIEVPAAGGTDS